MIKQKLMTARRIIFAVTLAGMIVVPATTLRAQTSDGGSDAERQTTQLPARSGIFDTVERIRQEKAQLLEGSWVITITPVVPPGVPQPTPFHAYGTFARGGAMIGTDSRRLFNIQHGAWAHLGGKEFAFTFIEELVDAMGNFAGTVKVRVKLTMTGKDEFVGVSSAEERNAGGELIVTRCGTIRGERITVEPLALQCQSVTPPQ